MTAMSLNTGRANKKQPPSLSKSNGGSSKSAISRSFVYDPDMGIFKCVVSPDEIPFTALDNDWEAIVSQGIGLSPEAATFIIDHEREPDETALLTPAPYDLPWWAASVRDEKHVLQAWEDIEAEDASWGQRSWLAEQKRSRLSVHLGIIDRRVTRRSRIDRGLPPKFIDLWRPYVGDDD
jgi:hypothetical protein